MNAYSEQDNLFFARQKERKKKGIVSKIEPITFNQSTELLTHKTNPP